MGDLLSHPGGRPVGRPLLTGTKLDLEHDQPLEWPLEHVDGCPVLPRLDRPTHLDEATPGQIRQEGRLGFVQIQAGVVDGGRVGLVRPSLVSEFPLQHLSGEILDQPQS